MSGILGVWNLDGRPVEETLIGRLARTLAHRGPDGCGVWTRDGVGLACRLLRVTPEAATEVQPIVHPSGSVLVFDGRLDNREELLALLRPCPDVADDAPDPALVLAAYDRFGDRLPERLAGDFALGLYDPARARLLLARDAIGVRPLHYARVGDTFLFASEIKAILAHPLVSPAPNDDMLAEYLLGGPGGPQGMTCFKGVYDLLPAHMALLSSGGIVVRRYWDFDLSRRVRYGSFEDYAAAFRDHLNRAVRRRIRSAAPVAVSVSGGLDSSSIFCLAETLRRSASFRHPAIQGLSYLSPEGTPSDEREFLVAIERDYRLAIERIPLGRPSLLDGAREEVWHIEAPFLDSQWNDSVRFFQTARGLGSRVILTGHWADQVLFDQAYLIDLVRRLAWGDIRRHLREYVLWMTDTDPVHFRRRFLLDLVKSFVPERLHPVLRRLRGHGGDRHWFTPSFRRGVRRRAFGQPSVPRASTTAHARSLYQQLRSGHQVMCMEWENKVAARHGMEIAFPFLDRDLVSFLMSIPGNMQTRNGVPKALLREAMRGILPDVIVQRRWKADFTHLVNEGLKRDYERVAAFLQDKPLAVRKGYLREEVLQTELARLKGLVGGPTCETAWILTDLLGFELWLQLFITSPVEPLAAAATGGST